MSVLSPVSDVSLRSCKMSEKIFFKAKWLFAKSWKSKSLRDAFRTQ